MEGSVVVFIEFGRLYFCVISSLFEHCRDLALILSLVRRYFVVITSILTLPHVYKSRDVFCPGNKNACGTLSRSQTTWGVFPRNKTNACGTLPRSQNNQNPGF